MLGRGSELAAPNGGKGGVGAPTFGGQFLLGADIARDRSGGKRLAHRHVEMDRTGWAAGGCREGARCRRAVVEEPGVVGVRRTELAEPADRRPIQLELVDGLAGAAPA